MKIADELDSNYGDAPIEVLNLFYLNKIKLKAKQNGIEAIKSTPITITIKPTKTTKINHKKLIERVMSNSNTNKIATNTNCSIVPSANGGISLKIPPLEKVEDKYNLFVTFLNQYSDL